MQVTRNFLTEKYKLNRKWWNTAHDRLIEHLQQYMAIEEVAVKGKKSYVYEINGELPDTIPPLPRKNAAIPKEVRYEEFTKQALGTEYKYNSRARIARQAIKEFGYILYQHTSQEYVAKAYVTPTFNKYAEQEEDSRAWVWYKTYEPLDEVALARWLQILKEEHITEEEQAEAFRKRAEGEDITVEVNYYHAAQQRFKAEFHDLTVKVPKYKCKSECDE